MAWHPVEAGHVSAPYARQDAGGCRGDPARSDEQILFGWSMGAGVATQIGIERPELVRKLILASPAYSRDGFHPGLLDGIENVKPEDLAGWDSPIWPESK